MKHTSALNTLAVCVTILAGVAIVSHAGPLNPPVGPIASTNKTLTEVEPRIAINATNTPGDNDATPSLFKITQPGSYYLTGNITGVAGKHGIEIASSNVSIDLMGYSLLGVAGSRSGIHGQGDRITIRNGLIVAWGLNGIWLEHSSGINVLGVGVDGCNGNGIAVTSGSVLENCTATNNSLMGFTGSFTTIRGCTAYNNSSSGFNVSTSTFTDCTATSNSQHGFLVSISTIDRCSAVGNGFDGIRAANYCIVTNNRCLNNGTAGEYSGIYLDGNDCRVENNHTVANDGGIASSTGVGHFIARNYAQGNPAGNYILPSGGNFVGTIVGTNAAMNTSDNCNVNISYP